MYKNTITKTEKTVNFLRNNGYKAIFMGDITDIEDGLIDFENNPIVNVGVGCDYYTISKEVSNNLFKFEVVENKKELLEKLVEFWS